MGSSSSHNYRRQVDYGSASLVGLLGGALQQILYEAVWALSHHWSKAMSNAACGLLPNARVVGVVASCAVKGPGTDMQFSNRVARPRRMNERRTWLVGNVWWCVGTLVCRPA